MHQVGFFAAPQQHVVAPEFGGDVFLFKHRAVGNVAGYPGFAVAHHRFANLAPHAVDANKHGAVHHFAIGQVHLHALRTLSKALYLGVGAQGDVGVVLAALQKHVVQIGAVNHTVGVAVHAVGGVTQWHANHGFAGADVVHAQARRKKRHLGDGVGHV